MGDHHPAFAGKLSIKTRSEEPAEVFDNVPFTPTDGICTPSPRSHIGAFVEPHAKALNHPRRPSWEDWQAAASAKHHHGPPDPRHRAAPSGAHAHIPPDVPHLVPGPSPPHLLHPPPFPAFPAAFHPSHAPLHHPPPFFHHHPHYPPPQYVALPTGRLPPSPRPPPGSPRADAPTFASSGPASGSGMGTGFYQPTVPTHATRGFDRGGGQRRSSRGGRGSRANRAARRSAEAAAAEAAGAGTETGTGTAGTRPGDAVPGTPPRPRTGLEPA